MDIETRQRLTWARVWGVEAGNPNLYQGWSYTQFSSYLTCPSDNGRTNGTPLSVCQTRTGPFMADEELVHVSLSGVAESHTRNHGGEARRLGPALNWGEVESFTRAGLDKIWQNTEAGWEFWVEMGVNPGKCGGK